MPAASSIVAGTAAGKTPASGGKVEAPGLPVHGALLLTQLLFGGFHVVAKGVLAYLDPLALVGLRLALATPLLLLLAWRHDRCLPRRADLPILALLGLLGVFGNQFLYILGLASTTATNAAILMCSIPVFAVAAGAALGIEAIGRRRGLGVLLAVAGAVVLLDPLHFSLAPGRGLGNLLILANCLAFALYLVLQRPVLRRLPWRTVVAWAFLWGSLAGAPFAGPRVAAIDAAALPAGVWWGIAYIVVFPTVVSYSLNTWAVRRSSPALVAAYTTLQPLFSTLLAALFLGERLSWTEAAGFALIAAGLWRVSARRPAS